MNPIDTVIHLVSEQPMPNLLPLMALKPQRVIQICSAGTRFAKSPEHLKNAAYHAGLASDFSTVTLESEAPNPEEVSSAIGQLLTLNPRALINVTGGTKLMSIGAFLAAEKYQVPTLYCDTASKTFRALGTAAFPEIHPFEVVAKQLTLNIVMAAHGKSPEHWTSDTAPEAHLKFGQHAWNLKSQHAQDFSNCRFSEHLRKFYRSDQGRIPSSVEKLNPLFQANLLDSIPGEVPPSILQYLDAAVEASLLVSPAPLDYRLAPGPVGKDKLRSHVETIANLLDGSWLELAVLNFCKTSKIHQNPHWSVEATKAGAAEAEYGETDLVLIDTSRCAVEVISCKTALGSPLEHLESLRTRANNLGGNHTSATLALFHCTPQNEKRIRDWGRHLRVRVLIGKEIQNHFQG